MDFLKDISDYYEREKKTLESLNYEEINDAMNCLLDVYEKGGNVYVFGNGGSGATASHMVCDFNKGVCEKLEKKFHFICLNDNIPLIMATANDLGFDEVFVSQLIDRVNSNDAILAISGSGNSANIVKAAEYAKKQGAKIISMTGYKGGKIANLADYKLHAPIEDMQIAEDIHMSFDHMMMQIFWKHLMRKAGKEPIYEIHK